MSTDPDLYRRIEKLEKIIETMRSAEVAAGTYPAVSGLTTGTVLRATGATSAAFGAVDLANTAAVTGTLASARGGTGVSNAGTITNASNTTITGGGTLGLAGYTLTVPATGTAALLNVAQTFSATNTFSAGLNVGTATGAAAGEISSSGSVYPGGTVLRLRTYETTGVANGSTWTVRATGTNSAAFLIVAEATNGNERLALLMYSAGAVSLVSNPDTAWSVTDTALKHCLYLSAGNLIYKNNSGAPANARIMILGVG